VLGVAFSFGIPMAFAAVRGGDAFSLFAVQGGDSFSFSAVQGSVPLTAWILLLGNLFWVLAYDTEYAMVDRDDDLKIGMKTSAITLGQWDVPVVAVFYLIYLLIWAVTPVRQAQAAIYFIAILIAGAQAVWHIALIRGRSREGCFKAFRLNHWLGFTVFLGLLLSYAANPMQ
jgi:4-hydroxybenzoate polyprenyltransferase